MDAASDYTQQSGGELSLCTISSQKVGLCMELEDPYLYIDGMCLLNGYEKDYDY